MSPFADPIYARWFRRAHHPEKIVRSFADVWFLSEVRTRDYGVFIPARRWS